MSSLTTKFSASYDPQSLSPRFHLPAEIKSVFFEYALTDDPIRLGILIHLERKPLNFLALGKLVDGYILALSVLL
jgi:hypothetical protein